MDRSAQPFTSRQTRPELAAALFWLPVHLFLLPRLLLALFPALDDSGLNLAVYGAGAVWMLLTQFGFLRRDFDALCDRPGRVLREVLLCYGAMLLFNLAVNGILMLFLEEAENPNNAAVVDMAIAREGPMQAMAVFLAPITEELMFRAGIFGALRRKSRPAAYLACMLLFSVYHVWGYALSDPMAWLFVVQYLPVSYLLCRCYERTNTVWGCVFFHMLINFIALHALTLLERLL